MTQPPEASAAPVSEAAPQNLPLAPTPNRAPADAEATAELLVDSTAFRAALLAELAPLQNGREIRAAVVARIGEARAEANAVIEARLAALPRAARKTVHRYADLTDAMVLTIFDVATQLLHPMQSAAEGEAIAVLAVGGYGRAEMSPHSDVDLLLLTPWKVTPWAESVIESMLYMLWDLKLKVGHSCRTVKDCLRLGREDYTIRTALLEHRFIAGNAALAEKLRTVLRTELFRGTEAEFIEAKLAERAERHRRQGGMRYVLEPNVKEGKGGLRDLQALYWIAKYIHQVETAADLVDRGVFTHDEYDTFAQAEDFLWAVRCHMHLITGRATDQLTFDLQVEVARRMRYEDTAARRGVEYFMQDYFRHATKVGELTRVFLTALEAQHMKRAPVLERLFRRRKKLKPGYRETGNRLNVVDPKAFLERPIAFLELFEEALRTGLLIHPDAMRLVAANLDRIDDPLRQDPVAARIFLDLLLKHGNPERALRRMNELGVLAAYIPEFEPIVAMMQFNVYHHYTVDEHIIQCISTLAQIERGELAEELPLSTKIVKDGVNRRVLYIAILMHDIGKGRPEDHSILGAQIARKVAPRLGLSTDECETVEWLVRSHLLMSDMAQKRDLSDPRTVRDFAKLVKTRKRLDLLTVLTVCDIRGVGPGTWNNWKAMLIRRLHGETAAALETGLEAVNRDQREDQAKRALREALTTWDPKDVRAELGRHYAPYWQGLSTESHVIFANLLKGLVEDEIRIDLHPDPDHDATRAAFALADHPGIFARMAGALALSGANVVDARTYTSKDGYATDVFWVQDADGHPYEATRLPRLRETILRTLKGELVAREAFRSRDKVKKREREFRFPTHITFDNEGSEIYTIIEVDTRDRPGLLFDLTRTMASANIYIASAVIATFGAQVVDSFYVKDMFGLKIHSKSRQESLEKRLRAAIVEGAERAHR